MNQLQQILEHNQRFVEGRQYEQYQTSKFPNKNLIILSCMDTRLSDLLPRAMNLKNGDAKFIKNAGAVVSHPFGSIMRSIIVAVYDLGADEICVVGHHGCGMSSINPDETIKKMTNSGVLPETIETLEYAGIDLSEWLQRIESIPDSVRRSVQMIRNHPLLPKSLVVHGLIIDPETGKLDVVVNGYQDQ
ncbi:carbonic anhydrase [Alicyclobacillus fastidiosus]|uniref:carbonic anhydrase n=1 Tax=Alicyclobacillus fastidiosus TaxID=392011 RepID=A0ABY6ZKX1_9BACL|nr:carbonic anhydrase [Alicyclobacillus fastidiosus]WAH43233.1 carbonic anhydrase [Alicyclobacillus fastidiosus]GMA65272.1 carbonic anhydrase [Alicyclobacillus fastidiosus]